MKILTSNYDFIMSGMIIVGFLIAFGLLIEMGIENIKALEIKEKGLQKKG